MEPDVYQRLAELETCHWWFVSKRKIVERVIRGRLPRLGSKARLLDVGCGTGGNLAVLGQLGAEAVGLEMDEWARSVARERSGVPVMAGRLPDELPFEADSFDLVVALDVLEHLEDDRAALRALYRLLKPGGHLLLTVPAYRFLWSRHDDRHHHKRRYTARSLKRALSEADLPPSYLSYFNTLLFPPIVLIRSLKRWLGGEAEDDALPPLWLNRILGHVMASESWLLARGRLPFGVSLLAIASKTAQV